MEECDIPGQELRKEEVLVVLGKENLFITAVLFPISHPCSHQPSFEGLAAAGCAGLFVTSGWHPLMVHFIYLAKFLIFYY